MISLFSLVFGCEGASEMAMAHAVQQEADKTPGKEARAMEGFATALRQVRHFLTPFETANRDFANSCNIQGLKYRIPKD